MAVVRTEIDPVPPRNRRQADWTLGVETPLLLPRVDGISDHRVEMR